MANPEHLKILKQGVEAWNAWRKENRYVEVELDGADLGSIAVDLGIMQLKFVDLHDSSLNSADLSRAQLCFANLSGAKLNFAKLNRTNLNFSVLFNAEFTHADLSGAWLMFTDLYRVDFSYANLSSVDLAGAALRNARLEKTNLSRANILGTAFNNVNLSEVIGLDDLVHEGPSTIGIDTIYKSNGKIPDKFLQDAGVPEETINIARSIRNGPPLQWHSCFISHSTKDEEFVVRLHSRMRQANMRVWCAAKDLKGGKKLHEQLFEAIQIHDRLLLVLSEHSIQSEWVMTEIRKARETEKKEKRRKLFPIRLTNFETLRDWSCFDADTGKDLAVEVREYFIPDFSNWKVLADGHPAAFESAFARLKKDLEAENSRK